MENHSRHSVSFHSIMKISAYQLGCQGLPIYKRLKVTKAAKQGIDKQTHTKKKNHSNPQLPSDSVNARAWLLAPSFCASATSSCWGQHHAMQTVCWKWPLSCCTFQQFLNVGHTSWLCAWLLWERTLHLTCWLICECVNKGFLCSYACMGTIKSKGQGGEREGAREIYREKHSKKEEEER